MSRRTWQQLARQQDSTPTSTAAIAEPASLQQLANRVPGLQSLLQQRETLEQEMQALGGEPGQTPAQRRWPVASAGERREEHRRWEQQRNRQAAQATDQALQRQQQQRNLAQQLDQRIAQARRSAPIRDPAPTLREPLLRPLRDRLEHAFQPPVATPEPASLEHLDHRWKQRQQRLLGVETGLLDALHQRSEQLAERRQKERQEARRQERQRDLLHERATERRRQRIDTSSY